MHIAETVPEDDEVTRILIESFYEGVAAAEIFKLRKNVMRGLSYNAERAVYNGIRILRYRGKPDKQYEIDETTAEIVRKIFNEFEMGVSLTDICSGLNKKGLTTIHGNNFTINALRHILQNKAYIGVYKWGDIVVPDGMPRIIDDKAFETVQKKFEANRRGGKGAVKKLNPDAEIADYWLTGKLYCKECGNPITGLSGTSRNGDLYYYYSCSAYRKRKYSLKNKSKPLLEKIT